MVIQIMNMKKIAVEMTKKLFVRLDAIVHMKTLTTLRSVESNVMKKRNCAMKYTLTPYQKYVEHIVLVKVIQCQLYLKIFVMQTDKPHKAGVQILKGVHDVQNIVPVMGHILKQTNINILSQLGGVIVMSLMKILFVLIHQDAMWFQIQIMKRMRPLKLVDVVSQIFMENMLHLRENRQSVKKTNFVWMMEVVPCVWIEHVLLIHGITRSIVHV